MLQFFGAFVWTVICCFKPTILNVATYGASKVVILLSSDDSIPRIYSNFSGCAIRIGLKHSYFTLFHCSHFHQFPLCYYRIWILALIPVQNPAHFSTEIYLRDLLYRLSDRFHLFPAFITVNLTNCEYGLGGAVPPAFRVEFAHFSSKHRYITFRV